MIEKPASAAVSQALEVSAEDLYESAPCGYFSTLANGQFVKVNQTFLTWTGFSREALLSGRRFQDLLTIPGKIYHDTHFGPLLQMQGAVNEIAFDVVCAEGKIMPVLVNAVEVRDESGKPLLNRATVFNATDRRSYERELLAARRKAEEIARTKADMLNMISHDMRNLLAGVLGAARRLETGELADGQQRRYLGLLRASAESMLLLANNLLQASRHEAGKLSLHEEPFEIRQLVDVALAPVAPAAEAKRLDLRHQIDARLPERLMGDQGKLGQVLSNLLSNAVKFTDQGIVELKVDLVETSADSIVLRFAVRDTGIGIEKGHLASITDPFSQASAEVGIRYGGAGLGLSLTRTILELYGSILQVESAPGAGSRFWFDVKLRCRGAKRQ